MEALIKALGQIPKWFTNLALIMVLIMLGVLTYSVTRTIIFDCGKVEIAGTGGFGGHCQNFTTSEWRHVDVPDKPIENLPAPFPDETQNQNICREAIYKASEKFTGIVDAGESLTSQIGTNTTLGKQIPVVWYKIKHESVHVDLLMYCLSESLLLITSGPYNDELSVRTIADNTQEEFTQALSTLGQ